MLLLAPCQLRPLPPQNGYELNEYLHGDMDHNHCKPALMQPRAHHTAAAAPQPWNSKVPEQELHPESAFTGSGIWQYVADCF